VAVSVITVPDLTVVTVLLLEETTRVVVVEVVTAQLGCTVKQRIVIRMATIENWLTILPFTVNLHIRLYLSRLKKNRRNLWDCSSGGASIKSLSSVDSWPVTYPEAGMKVLLRRS
jgi:hypothetical protein